MALQIRRGTTAERTARRFLEGELVYDTTLQQVFVGDSVDGLTGTLGGKTVTAFTQEDARDAVAQVFAAGTHSNINFSYNDDGINVGSFSAAVNLTSTPYVGNVNVTGNVNANGFNGWLEGNVFANDSTLLVDAGNARIPASVVQGTFTGNVIGNSSSSTVASTVTLTPTNTTNASHFITFVDTATGNEDIKTDTSLTYNPNSNTLTAGTFSGNVVGTVTGNIFTNLIDSVDSSAISFTPQVNFNSNVVVENVLTTSNLNATGKADVTITDNTAAIVFTPVALNVKAVCFNTASSGPIIDFNVESSIDGLFNPAQIFSYRDAGDSGTLEIRAKNPNSGNLETVASFNSLNGSQFSQIVAFSNSLNISEVTAPATSVGVTGDVAGDFRIGQDTGIYYIYYCTADYDGVADIWVRMPFTATPW